MAEKQPGLRMVIVASSLGTVFEWYDFFVYGTLAALLGKLFFPADNPTAALLLSLATFGAGFGVRPLGAVLFGRLGDRLGRKYTFLITITLMGVATAAVGLLPTFASAGLAAPALLVALRLVQGLALGGEYGGAAIYVAEHAPAHRRGQDTSWIQFSIFVGFILSIGVVIGVSSMMSTEAFEAWGWRIPFLLSIVMLAISLWIRMRMRESPVFEALKAADEHAKSPLKESFACRKNMRAMLVAMMGVAAGLTVIFYTAQFYSLYFLQSSMRIDGAEARELVGIASLLGAPAVILIGRLSDRIGRRPVMIAGYAATLLLLFPAYRFIAESANPALVEASRAAPVTVETAGGCGFDVFASKGQATPCARVLDYLSRHGVSYEKADGPELAVRIAGERIVGEDTDAIGAALLKAGYPETADPERIDRVGIVAAVLLLVLLSCSTIGAAAAILVELFPARIRYTSMSIPYHVATGYFGGFLPFVSQYIVARSGDAFAGLWYTFAIVAVALLVAIFMLPETRGRDVTA